MKLYCLAMTCTFVTIFGCGSSGSVRRSAATVSSAVLPITSENFTSVDDPIVRKWAEVQNKRTSSVISNHKLDSELSNVFSYLPINFPVRLNLGSREIYRDHRGLILIEQDQQEMVVVDIKKKPAGSVIADFSVSKDGRYLAYSISQMGDDIAMWSVFDLDKKQILGDASIPIRLFSLDWNHDSTGFYYSRSESKQGDLARASVMFHRLGTESKSDIKIFESPERLQATNWIIAESDDGETILSIRDARSNGMYSQTRMWAFAKSSAGADSWQTVIPIRRTLGRLVSVVGEDFILRSSECGDGFCLMSVSMKFPYKKKVIIPVFKDLVMQQPARFGNFLAVPYHDRKSLSFRLRIYTLDGKFVNEFVPSDYGQDNQGTLSVLNGHVLSKKLYFHFSSWTDQQGYLFDVDKNEFQKVPQLKPSLLRQSSIKTRLDFVSSYDGAKVPVWTVSRGDLKSKPTFLFIYAYGGIGVNVLPFLRPDFLMALELGATVVMISNRGGEELGAHWYLDGAQDKEMRPVKDIVWATRWIKNKRSFQDVPAVISGGSFGGMHTYMTYVYYQDDFDIYLPEVPLSDVAGFVSSNNPNVPSFMSNYLLDDLGAKRDADGNIIDFNSFLEETASWSPINHVQKLKLAKPMLSFAGTYDGRGGPHQVYFMQTALQNKFGDTAPVYMYEYPLGHIGLPIWEDQFIFTAYQLKLTKRFPLVP